MISFFVNLLHQIFSVTRECIIQFETDVLFRSRQEKHRQH